MGDIRRKGVNARTICRALPTQNHALCWEGDVTKLVWEGHPARSSTRSPSRGCHRKLAQGHMPSGQPGGSSDEPELPHKYFRTSLATSTDVDRELFIRLLGGKSRMPPTPHAPEQIPSFPAAPAPSLRPAFAPISRLYPEPQHEPSAPAPPPSKPVWLERAATPSGGTAQRAMQGYVLNSDELERLHLAAAVHTAERLVGVPPPPPLVIPVRPGARNSRSQWSSMAIKDPKRQSCSFATSPRYVQPKVSRALLRATVLEGLPAFHGRVSPRRPLPGMGSPRLRPLGT